MAADDGPAQPVGRRPKRQRLSRATEFERVYRQGRSHGNRYFVLHVFPRKDGPPGQAEPPLLTGPRLGLSVSRRVGGAVQRNQVKRLLREAYGEHAARLADDQDIVIVARPPARDLAEREGLEGVRTALGELVGRVAGDAPRM